MYVVCPQRSPRTPSSSKRPKRLTGEAPAGAPGPVSGRMLIARDTCHVHMRASVQTAMQASLPCIPTLLRYWIGVSTYLHSHHSVELPR